MKVSLIVPCYNEEEGLPNLFSTLDKLSLMLKENYQTEIILIDDGSQDNTLKLLQDYSRGKEMVKVLRHDENRGLGAALKTGFANAAGDIMVTFDSDLTYNPLETPKLLDLMGETTDIVSGSPYHPQGRREDVSPLRVFLSRGLSKIYRVVLHSNIYSFSGMFRAYRSTSLKKIPFEANDFLATTEILVKAIRRGFEIKEYPTTLRGRQAGTSKLKIFYMIRRHLRFILGLIFQREDV